MGLTYGFYIRGSFCKYDTIATKKYNYQSYKKELEYLNKNFCSQCKYNAFRRAIGCWTSSGTDRFLEWTHQASPELEHLIRITLLKKQKNTLIRNLEKINTNLFTDDNFYTKLIEKLPVWILILWDKYENFFWRHFKIILSPKKIKQIISKMKFQKNREYRDLEYCFLTFSLNAVQMNVPLVIEN